MNFKASLKLKMNRIIFYKNVNKKSPVQTVPEIFIAKKLYFISSW